MKSYLDLVNISSKVHKRQNKMSVFCIALAVFLVTTIFGMADMFIRSQIIQARMEYGNWHVSVNNISEEQAALISARPEVTASSWYGVLNYKLDEGYILSGKDVTICGSEESWLTEMQSDVIKDGTFPQNDNEAVVTENVKTTLGLQIGDQILIDTPEGTRIPFTISGFSENFHKVLKEDAYAVFLRTKEFRSMYPGVENG